VKGSFGSHFDELVKHFPDEATTGKLDPAKPRMDPDALKEKIDIHALLFQQAWPLERDDNV
jgi:hypothetical protein